MIDWVSAILPCKHDPSKLISGIVMSFDAQGENEWTVNKTLTVEGSYSSKIQIKSHTENQIYISGNPTKFLQGHNLFGTNDHAGRMGRGGGSRYSGRRTPRLVGSTTVVGLGHPDSDRNRCHPDLAADDARRRCAVSPTA